MDFDFLFKNNIIGEILYGETKSLIIKKPNDFPIYLFMKFYAQDSTDINFKIINYLNDLTDFTIEGFVCDYDDIEKKGNEKFIDYKGYFKGKYDLFSKNGFLTLSNFSYDIGNETNYLLIKIDLDNKTESNIDVLIEIIALPKETSLLGGGYIPVNNFISGSFNLLNEKENKTILYTIYINDKKNNAILEFNKNYEGINITFVYPNSTNYTSIIGNGFTKYLLNNAHKDIPFKIILENVNNTQGLLNANYMIRYYSDYIKNTSSEFKFYNDSIIKDNETIGENITRLLFEFYIKPIYKKYKICGSLFLKENLNELLSTSAFLNNKPIANTIKFVHSSESKLSFNMTINTTNITNYTFIMQLKIVVGYDEKDYYRSKQFLVYTIEMDLTEYLKNEENKGKEDKNEKTILFLYILIGVIIVILIVVFIVIGIIYFKFKKKNKDLKEKVLKISFSTGQSDEVLNRNNTKSKRDQEYETTFI